MNMCNKISKFNCQHEYIKYHRTHKENLDKYYPYWKNIMILHHLQGAALLLIR